MNNCQVAPDCTMYHIQRSRALDETLVSSRTRGIATKHHGHSTLRLRHRIVNCAASALHTVVHLTFDTTITVVIFRVEEFFQRRELVLGNPQKTGRGSSGDTGNQREVEIAIECLKNGVPALHYDAVNITVVDLKALSRYKRAAGFESLASGGDA